METQALRIIKKIERGMLAQRSFQELLHSYITNANLNNPCPLNDSDTILLYLYYYELIIREDNVITFTENLVDEINEPKNKQKALKYIKRRKQRVEKYSERHKEVMGSGVGERNKFFVLDLQDGINGLIILCFVRGLRLSFLTFDRKKGKRWENAFESQTPTFHDKTQVKPILSLPGKQFEIDRMNEDIKKLAESFEKS